MKTNKLILAIAAILLGFTSCNKDENEPTLSNVAASKTSLIKIGEPVNFTFSQAPEGSAVEWNVLPGDNAQISASGNTASVQFSIAGSYTVNAAYGAMRGSASVSVQDSIYNPGGGGTATYEPLTGDQVFITVTRIDSMGISGLDFSYITENTYSCLNNNLLLDNFFNGKDLKVEFKSVYIPSEEYCLPGEDNASSGTAWYPIDEGSHVFEVVLDGTTYSGSFIKSGTSYTFTWPYISGVTLTPLTIN
jgi:hypothetical protein